MRVNYATVSSDGFMINLQAVLLKLFEPVMDVQYSKLDKVDSNYYRTTKRLDVKEETKINATKEEGDEYYSSMDVDAKPNFISDVFFLLNHIHHLGLSKTIGTRKDLEKGLSELEEDLKNMEARQGEYEGVSGQSSCLTSESRDEGTGRGSNQEAKGRYLEAALGDPHL